MKTTTKMLLALFATTLGAACGASSENAPDTNMPPQQAQPPAMPHGNAEAQPQPQPLQPSQMCPTELPGVSVTAQDMQDGSALVFTASAGNVDQLRGRVQNLASMMNNQRANQKPEAAPGQPAPAPGQQQGATNPGEPVATHARVENTERGARLILTPADPAQLSRVRAFAQQQASRMSSGDCSFVTRMYQGTSEYLEQQNQPPPSSGQPAPQNPSQSQPPEQMPDQIAPPEQQMPGQPPPPDQTQPSPGQVPDEAQPPPDQMPDQSQGQPSPGGQKPSSPSEQSPPLGPSASGGLG